MVLISLLSFNKSIAKFNTIPPLLFLGCPQRKAGHERIETDRRGECDYLEVLSEHVLGRHHCLCNHDSNLL